MTARWSPSAATVRRPRGKRESFIHIHVGRIDAPAKREALMQALEQTLRDVRLAVQDWQAMRARVQAQIAAVKDNPPPLPIEETAEAIQFLEWLTNNNFTFLGIREYEFKEDEQEVDPQFESGLGILRQRDVRVLRRGNELVTITPEVRQFLAEPKALIITKANVRSRVHRRVYMDYIGVKRFDSEGAVIGEFRIVGLFTSNTYTRSARSVPYLRRKLDAVQRRAGFDENSHSGKALANVLESYPRDDLFQIDEDTLYEFALAIMQLEERPRVRVLARRDRFDRFVSVLVYIPRERFGSGVRIAIGEFLARVYKGRVSAFYPFFPEGPLVRVHFIIGRSEGETPNPPRSLLEDEVAAIVRTWSDRLEGVVALVYDTESRPDRARALPRRFLGRLSGSLFGRDRGRRYPRHREPDIGEAGRYRVLSPHRRAEHEPSTSLKVWSAGRPIPLSERVPVLENMGFKVVDERTFRIDPAGGETREIWLHDMLLERDDGGAIDLDALAQRLQAAFLAVIGGEAENDGFNALVLAAGLPWRDIALLRTIARFLRQARIAYSQDYLWTTLRKHAGIAERINALFHVKFDPKLDDLARGAQCARKLRSSAEIETALGDVASLDEDVILRRFVNAVQAAVRTNFFQSEQSRRSRSSSRAARSKTCRRRGRCSRSSSIRRAWKAAICASARSRAAASAGPTGRRISAPRCWAWSKPSR